MDYKQIMREARPDIKESTLLGYVSKLKPLKKIIGDEWISMSAPDLVDAIELFPYKDLYKKSILSSLVVLFKALNKPDDEINYFTERVKNKQLEYEKAHESNSLISEGQINNVISYNDLVKYVSMLSLETQQEHMLYVILKIHMETPYRNDLANIRYVGKREFNKADKSQDNYLYEDKKKLSFYFYQDDKTTKPKPEEFQSLSSSVSKLVRAYIKKWDISKGDVLFPVSKNYLSQLLIKTSQKYIGKNISTLLVRKIVASHNFQDSKLNQESLAKKIGHSVSTQNLIYNKSLPS